MKNAEKRVSRLEKEKAETKAAKKSIHDCLGEKKQQRKLWIRAGTVKTRYNFYLYEIYYK